MRFRRFTAPSPAEALANGISAAGSGIEGFVFSYATEAMINKISLA